VGVEHLAGTLALIGIVIVVSALLSGAVERSGIPQVAIFLLLGAVLGPLGLGVLDVQLESASLQVITTLALVLVLFSDAISVEIGEIRTRRRLALAVLGPGTLLPALLIALAAWALLDLHPAMAAILGAALASTDPVLLRSLLRHRELPVVTKMALRLESGMNDVVLLPIVVLAMLAMRSPAELSSAALGRSIIGLFLLGPALGAAVGWLGITVLDQARRRIGVRRDYESIYALGLALTAYAVAEAVGGSGFLSAFTAGLVVAVLDVELCDCFLDFGEATSEIFLLLAFVAFGGSLIWMGLGFADWRTVLFAMIALLVRTLVLYFVLGRVGVDRANRGTIAWLGPRGLSSLLLALLPVFAGVPGAGELFAITCLVVLISVLLHGGGIALYLRRLAMRPGAVAAPRREPLPVLEGAAAEVVSDTSASVPERIDIPEMLELQRSGEPVVIVDSRSDRTYRLDDLQASGAIRLPPDEAVRTARERGLAQRATVVVYCA
jgi:sodium/hydrogen antiporter